MTTVITGIRISFSRFSEVPQASAGEEVTPGAEAGLVPLWASRRRQAAAAPGPAHPVPAVLALFLSAVGSFPPPPHPLPPFSLSLSLFLPDGCFQYQVVYFPHKTVRSRADQRLDGSFGAPCTPRRAPSFRGWLGRPGRQRTDVGGGAVLWQDRLGPTKYSPEP